MKSSFGCILSLAGAAIIGASSNARAQDFFRDFGPSRSSTGIGPVTPSEYTYRDAVPSGLNPKTPAEEAEREDKYNFAIGPVRFAISAGIGIEWNDNITLSEHNRESDFILRPMLDVDATWRFTEVTQLRFAMGVGYAKYFQHSEFDTNGLLFSPNSALELKFELGVLKFMVRDRFSYQEEPYDVPQLSNVAVYRRYENQFGLMVAWEVNPFLTLTGGYDHYNLWTVDREFSSEERAVDTFFFRPTYQLAPNVKLGLNVAWSIIDFSSDERQDGTALLIGPLVEWQITDVINLYAEAGFQRLAFNEASNFDNEFFRGLTREERALFRDDEDANTYYFRLEIQHRPNDVFEHRLSASKTAEIGFGSNFYDLYHIEYNANYKGIRDTEIGPTLFYEYYQTSGPSNEEASRFGLVVGIRHHLTNSLTLGLDYRFLYKDSNVEGLSYYQNLVFLSVHYKF